MKFYRGTQNKPHRASTPGVTYVTRDPRRAAQWGLLAGSDNGTLVEIWELDIPDKTRVTYSLHGWISEGVITWEEEPEVGFREMAVASSRYITVARWGTAADVPIEAEEVRIDEPFRMYPQRLVAIMEWRDGAYWWLDEANTLTRISHDEWLENL